MNHARLHIDFEKVKMAVEAHKGREFTIDDLANWTGLRRMDVLEIKREIGFDTFADHRGQRSGIEFWRAK